MILGQGVRGNRTSPDTGKAGFGRESALEIGQVKELPMQRQGAIEYRNVGC